MTKAPTWIDDCHAWCQQVKYLAIQPEHQEWREKQPNTLWLRAQVLNSRRETMPNLYFKAEYRLGIRTGRETYDFQLMWRDPIPKGQHRRVLCVEIDEVWKRTHAEPDGTDIYGTHVQLGDKRAGSYCVREWRVPPERDHWRDWARRFGKLAWLGHTSTILLPPFGDDLFG
ncbi:hypothetical protein [Halomonas organivorans]|uniref:Uncharacterized protein n=1 Tax=Halomonas organivorans TaxID=257772 RepID=A0A7W5G6J4_9GAMM|nr:hypothetical protein [Halomonas organivorans]MBB3142220.1 hypothetical protein [Halomonas organivorans]